MVEAEGTKRDLLLCGIIKTKMKIISFFSVLLIGISLFTVKPTYAWPNLDTNVFDNAYGVSCGVSGSPPTNKCCAPLYWRLDLRFDNGYIDSAVSIPRGIVETVFNGVLSKIASEGYNAVRSVTGPYSTCYQGSTPSVADPSDKSCVCVANGTSLGAAAHLCNALSPKEKITCEDCFNKSGKSQQAGIWTGIGCVYGDLGSFVQNTLLGWGIGLAGFTSLLCIIYAAFMMQISRGNAEKIKKAQELLTSCIMGLLLIIFSIFILRIIGVNLLRIPGFS